MNRKPKDIFLVSIQFVLFVTYLFRISNIDFTVPHWLQYAGLFLTLPGFIISRASLFALNRNLSVFPTPKHGAELIQSGIYKYMRHPIYTSILLFTFGFSMYSENTLRLLIFFALLILFRFKAAYEEKILQGKFPNYAAYKKKAGMFLPWL